MRREASEPTFAEAQKRSITASQSSICWSKTRPTSSANKTRREAAKRRFFARALFAGNAAATTRRCSTCAARALPSHANRFPRPAREERDYLVRSRRGLLRETGRWSLPPMESRRMTTPLSITMWIRGLGSSSYTPRCARASLFVTNVLAI